MEINKFINESEITIIPNGRLDSATSQEFNDYIFDNFTEDFNKIVIDFSNVDYISSKGLRVLVTLFKSLNGRKMELINENASVSEILRISGLKTIFEG